MGSEGRTDKDGYQRSKGLQKASGVSLQGAARLRIEEDKTLAKEE